MNITSPFKALQRTLGSYAGDALTPTIEYYDRQGNLVTRPLMEATLDELAFAMQRLQAEGSVLHRQRMALENLYTLAREHRCLGSATVQEIASEVAQ
jgi:hypothetical protein